MKKLLVHEKTKKNLFLVFFISLFLAFCIIIFFVVEINQAILFDFISLLTGALIIKSGEGENLYNISVQTAYQQQILDYYGLKIGDNLNLLPYLNFPLLSVLFIPFTFFNFLLAFKLYVCVLIFCLLIISFLAVRVFKKINFFSLWFPLPFLYYPSIGATLIGQTSVLLTLLVLLIYWQLKQKKYFVDGVLSAFLLLKIQYIILVPFIFLIVKRKGEFLKGFILSFITILIFSFSLTGSFWNDYVLLLANAQTPEFGLLDSKMFTLYGSLKQTKYFSTFNFGQLFLINGLAYGVVLILIFLAKNKTSFERIFTISILATMVFCVHGVDYDQSLLLIPIFILINKIKSDADKDKPLIAILIMIILSPILIILSLGFYSSLLLLFLMLLLFVSWKRDRFLL